jgi:hypothetical protein
MTATPPDWTLVFDVRTLKTDGEKSRTLQGAANELKKRGSTHARATIVPEAGKVFVEGWKVRPELETPIPTQADGEMKP